MKKPNHQRPPSTNANPSTPEDTSTCDRIRQIADSLGTLKFLVPVIGLLGVAALSTSRAEQVLYHVPDTMQVFIASRVKTDNCKDVNGISGYVLLRRDQSGTQLKTLATWPTLGSVGQLTTDVFLRQGPSPTAPTVPGRYEVLKEGASVRLITFKPRTKVGDTTYLYAKFQLVDCDSKS